MWRGGGYSLNLLFLRPASTELQIQTNNHNFKKNLRRGSPVHDVTLSVCLPACLVSADLCLSVSSLSWTLPFVSPSLMSAVFPASELCSECLSDETHRSAAGGWRGGGGDHVEVSGFLSLFTLSTDLSVETFIPRESQTPPPPPPPPLCFSSCFSYTFSHFLLERSWVSWGCFTV